MALPCMHTILLNQIIVLLAQSFNECFTNDEQAIIGAFLTTLGDMISLNSSYLSFQQNQSENSNDDYELLEKSIEKLKEELEKIKNNVQEG